MSAIAVIIPILYNIIIKEKLRESIFFTLILNIIGVLVLVLINVELGIRVRDAIFFGLFYCIVGAYINQNEFRIKQLLEKINIIRYLIIIGILFALSIFERYIYTTIYKGVGNYYLSTIPLSTLIFLLCVTNTELFKGTIINKIGKNTLTIYLIHPLIMNIISLILVNLKLDWILNTIVYQVLYTPLILILSYAICNIIQFIKYITSRKLSNYRSLKSIPNNRVSLKD